MKTVRRYQKVTQRELADRRRAEKLEREQALVQAYLSDPDITITDLNREFRLDAKRVLAKNNIRLKPRRRTGELRQQIEAEVIRLFLGNPRLTPGAVTRLMRVDAVKILLNAGLIRKGAHYYERINDAKK